MKKILIILTTITLLISLGFAATYTSTYLSSSCDKANQLQMDTLFRDKGESYQTTGTNLGTINQASQLHARCEYRGSCNCFVCDQSVLLGGQGDTTLYSDLVDPYGKITRYHQRGGNRFRNDFIPGSCSKTY